MRQLHVLAVAAVLFAGPAVAQTGGAGHSATDHSAMGHGGPADAASSGAFAAANARMHEAMAVPMTGDADRDFLSAMIAHHQGAIDMAKVELEHGRNAEARAMAEKVVAAQEAEIAEMRRMLAAMP